MANYLAPIINEQQFDANGDPLSGGEIFVYLAGTSTPATTYTTKAGGTPNTFPIDLNTLGVNEDGEVWLIGGSAYKFVIKDSAGVTLRTLDNISGINDTAITADQWVVYQSPPTYVSATSFTVAGDQTQTFQVRRRIKTTNTGGTIYSTITASSYLAPNTTVTVQNDSGVLDSGLSQVSYGLISVLDSSVIGRLLNVQSITATGTYTPTPGTTRIIVEGQGSGGAGGGSAATAAGTVAVGGGGGGGGRSKTLLTTGFYPTVAVTIGAGGVPAAGASGGAGGNCTFGAFMTCNGGAGGGASGSGAVSGVSGGAGGAASGGTIVNSTGSAGGSGLAAFASAIAVSGFGGDSSFGSGAIPSGVAVNGGAAAAAGTNSSAIGSGGSGGVSGAGGGATSGGGGSAGAFIVYEYA